MDAQHHFKLNYQSDTPVRIDFTHAEATPNQQWYQAPKFYAWVFEPDDAINISFDAQNFWQTLEATGNNSEKINYYIADFRQLDLQEKWRNKIYENLQIPVSEQYAYLDKILEMKQNLFQQYKNSCTAYFQNFQDNEIQTMVLANKATTIFEKMRKDKIFKLHSEPTIQQFLKEKIHTNKPLVVTADYVQYCADLTHLKQANEIETNPQLVFQAPMPSEPAIEEILALGQLHDMMRAKAFSQAKIHLQAFQQKYPTNLYGAIFAREMVAAMAGLGRVANFTLTSDKGVKRSLDEWKGKVVVLDFWASWCKPCIGEMPYAHQVQEHFRNNKDIVFVNISIDEDENAWKNAIEKYHVSGINLLADGNTRKDYKVDSVPTYYVVQENGIAIAEIPPCPSEDDGKALIAFLEKILR